MFNADPNRTVDEILADIQRGAVSRCVERQYQSRWARPHSVCGAVGKIIARRRRCHGANRASDSQLVCNNHCSKNISGQIMKHLDINSIASRE